jgi:D-alanyl-D-alanine carboxypeptidase
MNRLGELRRGTTSDLSPRWSALLLLVCLIASAALACDDEDEVIAPSVATVTSTPEPTFDDEIAAALQQVLNAAVSDPDPWFPGAILRVEGKEIGTWTGTAGVGDVEGQTPIGPGDKFRAGSIVKPFVSVAVLQLVEEGALSLDDTLPEVLPESVHARFQDSDQITVRMLLNHSSGLPEWLGPAVYAQIEADPGRVWDVAEFLDLSAAQAPNFAPGTGYAYSNADYTLLGEIIENITGDSWRSQVNERVIEAAGLENTSLPAPGDTTIKGSYAHGYAGSPDAPLDLSGVDPSMAGAAGGSALVTTVSDLARFWETLLAGGLFDNEQSLENMFTFIEATGDGGLAGYGLGLEKYVLPGGVELVGHLGGAPGYRSFVGYLPAQDVGIVAAMTTEGDPTPVLLPVVEVLTGAGG